MCMTEHGWARLEGTLPVVGLELRVVTCIARCYEQSADATNSPEVSTCVNPFVDDPVIAVEYPSHTI